MRSAPRAAPEAERFVRGARRRRAMYSGNRSGGQGHWEGGGAAGAEGPGPAGTLSPAPLFSPGTYERLALLLGSIGLLGVGNNLLVLVLYYKFQRLRTPTHLLLVNISLSDLLVSLFGVTFTFVSCLRNGWVWDTVGCVWDGFSSSLFGESGWEERAFSPPHTCAPCLATTSARPLAAQPARGSSPRGLSPSPPCSAAPAPLVDPGLHGFPSPFLPLLSPRGGLGSGPVATPVPAAGPQPRPGFAPSSSLTPPSAVRFISFLFSPPIQFNRARNSGFTL